MARPPKFRAGKKSVGRPRKIRTVADPRIAPKASTNGTVTTTVDGQEARIDLRPPPPPAQFGVPKLPELLDLIAEAHRELEDKIIAAKSTREAQKIAQLEVNSLLAKVRVAWENRDQLELPLAGVVDAEFREAVVECASCHDRAGTVPLANGTKWCVLCVQTALAEPRAQTPSDMPPPTLDDVISALADALRADDGRGHDAAAEKVEALADDPRDLAEIRAELLRVASKFKFTIGHEPPYVSKIEMASA